MRYAVLGAGGTGGAIGACLAKGGKDSVIIARGEHLRIMQENGLTVRHQWDGSEETISVNACSAEDYPGKADVIFVCVKGYSLDSAVPFIRMASGPQTAVIPILNIFGAGKCLQGRFPDAYVLDGCIYVSANREAPGILLQHSPVVRIVYGPRQGQENRRSLADIEEDLKGCGIAPVYSSHIERDCLEKFSYVSPIGAAGIYLNATAGDFQKEGTARELFKAMVREVENLAAAMGFAFEKDYVESDLEILSGFAPGTTTSMQRDVMAGRASEVDGLVYQVVRLAHKYGINVPEYEKVAAELQSRGLR